MKRALPVLLLLWFICNVSVAGNAHLFKVDLEAIEAEIDSAIEATVCFPPISMVEENCPPLNIPSMAWGLVCGLPGALLVVLKCDDTEQRNKAWSGCVASGLLFGGGLLFAL